MSSPSPRPLALVIPAVLGLALPVVFAASAVSAGTTAGTTAPPIAENDRWNRLPVPVTASTADVAIDAGGTAYALTHSGLLSRLDGDGWTATPRAALSSFPALWPRPGAPGDLLVASWTGLRRTTDGGRSWREAGPRTLDPQAVAFDPSDPDRWIVAYGAGLVTTTADDGMSWTTRVLEALDGATAVDIADLAVAPDGDAFALLTTQRGCGVILCFPSTGLFRSRDGGATWSPRATDIAGSLLTAGPDGTLYAQLHALGPSRSVDDGATWQPLGLPTSTPTSVVDIIVSGDTILVATLLQGLYASTDGGTTWSARAATFQDVELGSLALDPQRPGHLLAAVHSVGGQDQGELPRLLASFDDGVTWEPADDGLSNGPTTVIATAPADGRDAIAAHRTTLLATADAGQTWTVALEDGPLVEDIAYAPSDANVAYAVGTAGSDPALGALRSLDGGVSWQPLPAAPPNLLSVAVAPDDADVVFAASAALDTERWGVHRSTDGGTTWQRMLDAQSVQVVFDRQSSDTVYALGVERWYRSRDRGVTWTDLGQTLTHLEPGAEALWSVALVPGPGTLRRSTDQGDSWTEMPDPPVDFYEVATLRAGRRPGRLLLGLLDGSTLLSTDSAESWTRLVGDPGLQVADLAVGADGEVWAATWGGLLRGLFESPPPALRGGRFVADVSWRTFEGRTGTSRGVLATDDTGVFWFFGRDNLELMVKVLDGRPVNGHWWVYYGALSNVEFTLTVTDTWNGRMQVYFNPLGAFASFGDVEAFDSPSVPSLPGSSGHLPPSVGARELELGDRFVATITWRDFEGIEGDGIAVPLSTGLGGGPGDASIDATGGFWFFDPRNLEMMVKVLDGRAVNGRFWVFFGSLTNVEFTLRIEDTETGAVREYVNPLGTFASVGDIDAF